MILLFLVFLNFLLIIILRFVDLEQISHYQIFHCVSSLDQLGINENCISKRERKREKEKERERINF